MADENERKDSSAVGKINSALNKGRNIQRAYKVAKTARTTIMAAEGAEALLSNPVGLILIAFGLVLVITFFAFFGGAPVAVGGDLSNNPTPSSSTLPGGSPGPSPSTNPNISAQLANDLVITGSGANQQAIADVQSIMSIPYKSSTYRNLITSNGKYKVNIIISNSSSCALNNTGGPGGNENVPINLLNWNCPYSIREKILIHETGHVIAIRNGYLGFPFSTYSSPPNPDSSCFTGPNGYLRTYSYKATSVMGNGLVESFPEAVSDNIVPYPTGTQYGDNIPNYSTTCANTYNWIKNTIYGGTTF